MGTHRRRTRRSASEWRRLIEAQAASGLSQSAFCAQQGLSRATFGYWKRKLRQAESAQGPAGGSETHASDWIDVSALLGGGAAPAGGGWQIELDLGNGLCLRLRQG